MKKRARRIIARILTALMIISVLPLDTWGTAEVAKAAEAYVHNFTTDGIESDAFYTITGNSKALTASYELNGETLNFTNSLKMESKTSVDFTSDTSGDLLLIFDDASNDLKIKVDGIDYTIADQIVSVKGLEAEDHKILKNSTNVFLCYISFTPTDTSSGDDTSTTVAKPTASPGAGEVATGTEVTLSAEEGAVIYYTLDGNEPDKSSDEYNSGPITINPPVTLKAIAIKDGVSSDVATYEYTLASNVQKPTADPSDGEVEVGTEVKLSAENGAVIYYTLDGVDPTTNSESYAGPITITPPVTLKAIAVKDGETSNVATFTYTLKLAAAPTVSIPSGTAVEKGTSVKLTADSADAIHYTLDGEDPTVEGGSLQKVTGTEAEIPINEAVTIKAVAVKNGVAGNILEASYTILKVETPKASKTGSVAEGTEITLTSATEGAVIYYTIGTDALDPDPEVSSTLHGTSPVTVNITADTTIKAIAVKDNYDNSDIVSFNYKVIDTSDLKTHVLDPDAIMAETSANKYEYTVPTVIEGTGGFFTAMAKSGKGASIKPIADVTTTVDSVQTSCYANLSWADVDLAQREYAAVITGGAMAVDSNSIRFTTEAYATGVVYYSLKSNTGSRNFVIQSGNDTTFSDIVASKAAGDNTKVGKLEFVLPIPGTYYVGFSGDGGIIPYMEVTEDFSIEPDEAPETVYTKTITVSDSTDTIIDAELVGDVDFINASDSTAESVDVVNILLEAESVEENNTVVTTGIKKKVAEQISIFALESDGDTNAYYYNLSLKDNDKTSDNALMLKRGSIKFQVSYDKLGMKHNDSLVILHGSNIIEEDKITRDNKSQSFWVETDSFSHPYIFIVNETVEEPDKLSIVDSYGYEEGACAEWKDYTGDAYDGYVAYVSTTPVFPENGKTQRIDNELIREYDGYWRVDTVGLAAGTYYIKVDAVTIDAETKEPKEVIASNTTGPLKVTNYDRSGFAFSENSQYKTGSGAYNDDGTLRAGAQVLYVTAATAKTVTLDVITNNKGETTECVGLQTILDARQKGYDTTPLDIRLIGCVTLADLDHISSSAEGLQIKGKSSYSEMNITIEGIGEDAVIKNFGMLIRGCGNIELRNFAVMAFMDDGISIDTSNCNIWVHDLDIFYGATGGDSDQAKGDGSVDIKGASTYITVSYNHFWDSGKCSLCGMEAATAAEFMVTYHHNWFDHSDSRHPRIRRGTIHIYNNYYDGNAKYGVGTSNASSAFVEANYFRNCNYPMIISGQASDALGGNIMSNEIGGMIKAYNNKIEQPKNLVYANSNGGGATASANAADFDAYLADSRDEQVPDTYAALSGGNKYNNFDTSTSYDLGVDPANIDDPNNVKDIVTSKAGRLNGGDFSRAGYTAFTGAAADTYYGVDTELKSAVVNYQTSVVSIGGINGIVTEVSGSSSGTALMSSSVNVPTPSQPEGKYTNTIDITLTSDTAGAVIYYTLDGSNPADAGNDKRKLYSGAISISQSVVIKAVAVVEENGKAVDSSAVVRYVYTISSGVEGETVCTITIYKAKDTEPETRTFYAGDIITLDDLPKYSMEGYTFDGWVDEDGKKINLPYELVADMTLIATWKGNSSGDDSVDDEVKVTYTITVDLNYDGAPSPTAYTISDGESINDLTKRINPTREDYTFVGWVDEDGANIELSYKPDKNMTIKATWTSEYWSVKLEKTEYTYTGTAIKPAVTVYDNKGYALVEGVDYTVKYSNNTNASVKLGADGKYTNINTNDSKQPTVTVSGKGILAGKYITQFVIKPKNIADVDVQSAEIRIETGKKASTPVVCYNGVKLGTKDYTYAVAADKTKTFSADGTIDIKGQGNFEGTHPLTVKVFSKAELKAAVKKFKVTVKNTPALVYSGENLVNNIISNITFTPALTEDSYAVTLPEEVKDAGTVKFMVVGLGEYSGCSVSKSIKIQPMTLDESKVDITNTADGVVNYTAAGAVLPGLTVSLKGKTEPLVNGKDYQISYTKNKQVGKAGYTITFKGNYKGKIKKTDAFTISKSPLDSTNAEVELPDKVCKENASCKAAPYVTINGVLVKASEYVTEYSVGDKNGTYTAKPKVTFGSEDSVTVYVKIKAKPTSKNYEVATAGEEITGEYTVWKKGTDTTNDLSKAKVTFHNQADCKDKKSTKFEYNGGTVQPAGVNITIGKSTTNLSDKCEIIYVNNINKGKATVIIKPAEGSGLTGGKVATFNIVSKNASGLNTSVFDNISDALQNFF